MVNNITAPDGRILTGEFGLERETLRVTADGYMAPTPHPFPDDEHIVRDFCENQAEINTGVHTSAEAVIGELAVHTARLEAALEKHGEKLWLYSNPPYITSPDDIRAAVYEGTQRSKHSYRMYLAEKYGKYKMTLSGIHVNYSLSEQLLRQGFAACCQKDFTDYKNAVYLRLAEGLVQYGWIINVLLSASPVCDGSYFSPADIGKPTVTRYASLRGGEEGYWNDFIPHLDYSSVLSYASSIQGYIDSGKLAGVSELYYPVRLKPRGANRLNTLVQNGVNHIEIRNVDINPFAAQGIDARDLQFIELLILYIVSSNGTTLSVQEQEAAVQNFKNAALLDIDAARIQRSDRTTLSAREAGFCLLGRLKAFYAQYQQNAAPYSPQEVLRYQEDKLTLPGMRYAERVITEYAPSVTEK